MKKEKFCALLCLCSLVLSSKTLAAEAPYYLTEKSGMICIFDAENNTWFRESTIPVSALPREDQTRIRQGYPLHSEEEVTTALEDFCS